MVGTIVMTGACLGPAKHIHHHHVWRRWWWWGGGGGGWWWWRLWSQQFLVLYFNQVLNWRRSFKNCITPNWPPQKILEYYNIKMLKYEIAFWFWSQGLCGLVSDRLLIKCILRRSHPANAILCNLKNWIQISKQNAECKKYCWK